MTVHVVRALDLCLAVAERQERLDRLAAEFSYRGNPNVTPNVARKKP